MRITYIVGSLLALAIATPAYGQEVEVSGECRAMSSYIDDRLTNQQFSTGPQAQCTILAKADHGLYAEAYVYADLEDPFRGERVLEIGGEWEVARDTTLTAAAGIYDYDDGNDPYVRFGVRHGQTTMSITHLGGVSDTTVLFVEHEFDFGDFTITPTGAVDLRTGQFNPGVRGEYRLTDNVSIHGNVGSRNSSGERDLVASVGFGIRF